MTRARGGRRTSRGRSPFGSRSKGGGIPERMKPGVTQRILACAEEHFAGKYTRIDVRFRGQFCYIDAYQEPVVSPGWPPADWGETREEYIKRVRETPVHLCRLRYLGSADAWDFAIYTYSHERYEPGPFVMGGALETPEDGFMLAANLYLQ